MRRPVAWSDSARDDLLAILRYIAAGNPDAAQRLAERIDHAAAALGDYATGRAGRVKGTYEKPVAGLPYILAYEIIAGPKGSEMIGILRIIHGAREWQQGQWPPER